MAAAPMMPLPVSAPCGRPANPPSDEVFAWRVFPAYLMVTNHYGIVMRLPLGDLLRELAAAGYTVQVRPRHGRGTA